MNEAELTRKVYAEWKELHHNATLLREFPELQNQYEVQMFWDCLADEISWRCSELSGRIKEKFGMELTFYSYGRSGATIAPHEWMHPAACNSFGGLDLEKAIGFAEYGLERYNALRKALKVLEYINEFWKTACEGCADWWKETKKVNEWEADIVAHEGMVPRMQQIWVKEEA